MKCEKWTDQNDTSVEQRKNLSPRQIWREELLCSFIKICECLRWRYFSISRREWKQEHGKKNLPRRSM